MNKHGVPIPEKCHTCQLSERPIDKFVTCNHWRKSMLKSDVCPQYIMAKKFENAGVSVGVVQDPDFIKFKVRYISEHPEIPLEEAHKNINLLYTRQKFIF